MSRADRHLVLVLALIGLAALVVSLPRTAAETRDVGLSDRIPVRLGDWTAAPISVEHVLPVDARSLEWTARLYESGQRRLWLGVARYPARNAPETRPALGGVVRQRGATSLGRDTVSFVLAGGQTLRAMRISVDRSESRTTAWYWYLLGGRVIRDEYSLRFWLGLNTVLGRDDPLFLVRVAAVDDTVPTDFIQALAPYVNALAGPAGRN